MSIENNIERIANALEMIVEHLTPKVESTLNVGDVITTSEIVDGVITTSESVHGVSPPAAPVAEPPAPVEQPPEPAHPAPDSPPAGVMKAPAMTAQELNGALVVEFRRLGSREGIDKAMADMGVTSVNDLAPTQYQQLLDIVKAFQ